MQPFLCPWAYVGTENKICGSFDAKKSQRVRRRPEYFQLIRGRRPRFRMEQGRR